MSEDNPPPSSEPPTEQPAAEPAAEPPSDVQAEGEPAAAQPEDQATDGSAEKPEEGKTEEQPEVQPEGQDAGDATAAEIPEGQSATAETTPTEAAVAGEAAAEVVAGGEPAPEQLEGQEVVAGTAGVEKTEEILEKPVPEVQADMDIEPEQTDEEFVSDLINMIISEVVGPEVEDDFITSIVNKIVAHAVGEKSSEGSEKEIPEIEEIEEINAEDVTSEVMKYLMGPESLRLEEERYWGPEFPPTCINYLNVIEFARRFVEGIIEKAVEVCLVKYEVEVKYRKKQVEIQNIRWPSIENFTIELGSKKIDEYIQMTFEVEENWLYKINFIAAQSDLSSDVYLYEVLFCIPTPCYPIAQATVSIYFSCDVSRVKPRECPIDVTYSIESLKEVLVPGKAIVNDDMLLRLIYSKLSVFKSLYF